MGAVVQIVLARTGEFVVLFSKEARSMGCRHRLVEIFFYVGPDMQLAAVLEYAAGVLQKYIREYTSLAVAEVEYMQNLKLLASASWGRKGACTTGAQASTPRCHSPRLTAMYLIAQP